MDYTVASVDEALSLLVHVANSPGLGVTELAKRSGNTKARAFRLLSTLEDRGFVQRRGELATYQLGYKTLLIGLAAQEQVSLVRQAEPYLHALGERFNENVQVRVRDGLESVCVARWESTHDVRIHGGVGRTRPLHAGASGKILLAFADEALSQAYLGSELLRFTANTITQRSKLTQELIHVRQKGYATSIGEIAMDVISLAAPVRDASGQVIAALGISVPSSRLTPDGLERFIPPVCQAAQALSAELGYRHER